MATKSAIPINWKGDNALSKANFWQHNYLITKGTDAKYVTDAAADQDGFTSKPQLVVAAETQNADSIAMLNKIGQYAKASILITFKLLLDTSISIKKLKLLIQEILCSKRQMCFPEY